MNKPEYYDWGRTFSHASGADIVFVIGARGYGKTYGLRKQFIRDRIKGGFSFVEIVRHKQELKGDASIQQHYFDKLAEDPEFAGKWLFKTQGVHAYIATVPEEGNKPKWEVFGYFVAITEAQDLKKRTFTNVKRLLLDEAILERDNPYRKYIANEYEKLANIVDTVTRERADNESVKPTLYLLGNAVDITNVYFSRFGITSEPKRGYSWHMGKRVLLHYVDASEYSREKAKGTVAGRMLAGTSQGLENVDNRFTVSGDHVIAKKTPNAKLQFVIAYDRKRYGIWLDAAEGYYYVTSKVPENTDARTYALTNSDMLPNYVMIQLVRKHLQGLADLFYLGIIKYDNDQTMQTFLHVLEVLGIRIK